MSSRDDGVKCWIFGAPAWVDQALTSRVSARSFHFSLLAQECCWALRSFGYGLENLLFKQLAPRRQVREPFSSDLRTLISAPRITLHCMLEPLTKKEQHELEEILRDPAKRRKQALKAIEAWVRQGTDKSGKSSKNSKSGS